MLRSGEEIYARVFRQRRIMLAIGRGMNQRRSAPPVFVRTIRVENLGHHIRGYSLCQQSIVIGERRNVHRVKDVEERMPVARWLRESGVEAAAPRTRNERPYAVEDARRLSHPD